MIKSLLIFLCMASFGFQATDRAELIGDTRIARQMICEMGFWYDGKWVKSVEIGARGVEVQPNPAPGFTFKISNEKIAELLKQVGSLVPKTFKGSDLSADYPNILQYMKVKLEPKDFFSSVKSKAYSYFNKTKYYPEYFAIELHLPEMEADVGDLIIQKVVGGQVMDKVFDLVGKQKILIGEPFILCTSPINTGNALCNEFHELAVNKWSCKLLLWKASTVNNLLDQSSLGSETSIECNYVDNYPVIEDTYTYDCLYRVFEFRTFLERHIEQGKIKVSIKFDERATLPFYFNTNFAPVRLSLTYPEDMWI